MNTILVSGQHVCQQPYHVLKWYLVESSTWSKQTEKSLSHVSHAHAPHTQNTHKQHSKWLPFREVTYPYPTLGKGSSHLQTYMYHSWWGHVIHFRSPTDRHPRGSWNCRSPVDGGVATWWLVFVTCDMKRKWLLLKKKCTKFSFLFRTDVTSAKDIGLRVGMLSPLQLLVYSSFRRLSN